MNYEELYNELQKLEKDLKDKQAAGQKYYKNAVKDTEKGDIKTLLKDLNTLSETLAAQTAIVENLKGKVENFDAYAYFQGGDFAEQLLGLCHEKSIDIQGGYPVYEVFPFRLRIDEGNQDVYLNRKRMQCIRPSELVGLVKRERDRMMKASFNEQGFLNELADVYDLAIMKGKKAPESDLYLTNLYKFMTPMARIRKDYDMQSFAFDLARLYISEVRTTKDGRKIQFGPSRYAGNKTVRILDREGKEVFLSMIRFYTP